MWPQRKCSLGFLHGVYVCVGVGRSLNLKCFIELPPHSQRRGCRLWTADIRQHSKELGEGCPSRKQNLADVTTLEIHK